MAALPLALLWLQEEAPDVSQTTEMYSYLAETGLDVCIAYISNVSFFCLLVICIYLCNKLQIAFIT